MYPLITAILHKDFRCNMKYSTSTLCDLIILFYYFNRVRVAVLFEEQEAVVVQEESLHGPDLIP